MSSEVAPISRVAQLHAYGAALLVTAFAVCFTLAVATFLVLSSSYLVA